MANRVLSCKPCNGNEKRDQDWVEFLKIKVPRQELLAQRHEKILDWVDLNGGHPQLDVGIAKIVEEEIRKTTAVYDQACIRIKNEKRDRQVSGRDSA